MPLSTSLIEETFTSREEGVKKLLPSILYLNLPHDTSEKTIINVVNRLLSTAKGRKEGLEYLELAIDGCSTSALSENALSWVNHCLIKFSDDVLRELKLRVLGKIIDASHPEADFNKKFTSDYASKVLENCLTTSHVNPYECKTALNTLTICMKNYPSWFGIQRQRIEKFILIFLDNAHVEVVEAAAVAFHYLQQTGGAGMNSVNHKANFTQNFHKLCRTSRKLYEKFFENQIELFHSETLEGGTFAFHDDPALDSQAYLHVIARRIHNVFKFLETMIRTRYPASKETKPKELLEVVSRVTAIHKCISGDHELTLENYQFSLLLTGIQSSALKLLRLFIIWYRSNSLPFSYTISKVIVDSVARSQHCECYKFDSLHQESSYRALIEWISIAKSSLHPQFQSQLLQCILKDITPTKTQITLTISEEATGKKSQKAKRRAMASRIIASGDQSTIKESVHSLEKKACQFALSALSHLLDYTNLNVKSVLLKVMYKSIFNSLIDIQSGKSMHPYTDPQLQAKLYEALVAIYNQNTLSVLPPLHTTLDILNRGSNSSNRFIATVCHRGLSQLESFCQPICPSLFLGTEREDEEEEGDEEPIDTRPESVDIQVDDAANEDLIKSNDSPLKYHVRYTPSDRSTVEDGLSDRATTNDNYEFQEIESDGEGQKQNDTAADVSKRPVVTAPSEEGHEILQGSYEEEGGGLDTSQKKPEDSDEIRGNKEDEREGLEPIQEEREKDYVEISGDKEDETVEEPVESTQVENPPQPNELIEEEEMLILNSVEHTDEELGQNQAVGIEENQEKEPIADEQDTDSVEPPVKKQKLVEETTTESSSELAESVLTSETIVDSKKVEEGKDSADPDASYLEEDSFVDQVKDYY